MVDRTNLQQVNALYSELEQMNLAIKNLDGGGKISSMTISPGSFEPVPGELPPQVATVGTQYMEYPAQMVTGIRQQFVTREQEIVNELQSMGLGGISAQPRAAAGRRR